MSRLEACQVIPAILALSPQDCAIGAQLPDVHLLYGTNSVDLDERVSVLLAGFDPQGMGASRLDLASASIDEVTNACHAAPFFGGARAVLLTNPTATTGRGPRRGSTTIEWDALLDVVKQSPHTTHVVIRANEVLPSSSVIVRAASQLKWNIERFPLPRGDDLTYWVAERGRRLGVEFGRAAAVRLLTRLYPTSWRQESRFESVPLDARLIASEIEKLSIAALDGEVTEALVDELVADRSGYTAFRLNDLIYSGETERGLAELEQVMSSGDEPERILAQFASEAAGLSAARALPEFDIASVSKASGISDGRLKMLRQKPASRNEAGLAQAIEKLREAEWTVKTGRAPRGNSVIVGTAAEVSEGFRRTRSDR